MSFCKIGNIASNCFSIILKLTGHNTHTDLLSLAAVLINVCTIRASLETRLTE